MDANVLPNVVADAVIEAVRREGHDLLLTEGEVFFYADGVWRPIGAAEQQWLQTLIQKEFERFAGFGKLGQLATAWKRLTEHPRALQAYSSVDEHWCTGNLQRHTRCPQPDALAPQPRIISSAARSAQHT